MMIVLNKDIGAPAYRSGEPLAERGDMAAGHTRAHPRRKNVRLEPDSRCALSFLGRPPWRKWCMNNPGYIERVA